MANPNGNKAKTNGTNTQSEEIPNFEGWVTEEVGFAPYWTPAPGEKCYATLVARDERDPEFVRYLLIAGMPIRCHRGPREGGEEVIVNKGEQFSMSAYVQLDQPFMQYLNLGVPVPMLLTAKEKVKGGQGSVWVWDIKVSPETKAMLTAARQTAALDRVRSASANG
jgi:hypothetical protein